MIKIIRSENDYSNALLRLESLIDQNPATGSSESDEMEVLGLLIDQYEGERFPVELPDPIEAIRFRLDQLDLTQRDLIPMIGSRSKVSEVMSGNRPLTLQMIRALHDKLGVPATVLLQERSPDLLNETDVEWAKFPFAEMLRRGWFEKSKTALTDIEAVLREFFAPTQLTATPAALFRRTRNERSARSMDTYAVAAWLTRTVRLARKSPVGAKYVPGSMNLGVMHDVARLSWSEQGPKLAVEYLAKLGVAVVVERHLSRTHIDGAALIDAGGYPVIGLTLRHDRLDNFWYSLMHELAHLSLHLRDEETTYVDDLDAKGDDKQEAEADDLAREALIPHETWNRSPAKVLRSADAAMNLARELQIHPAIVAGRIRHERKNFRLLGHLVGAGEVRALFPEVHWN
jgi:HTH-type transcriptional regulator/antitoxin HigA